MKQKELTKNIHDDIKWKKNIWSPWLYMYKDIWALEGLSEYN